MLFQTSENNSTISIPELVYYNSTYFEDELFFKSTEGKLKLQIGFDLYYNSLYYAPAYMPATGQFYLQRETKYGDYPMFNAFANLKIKRMRLFFKMEHVTEGVFDRNYFSAMHYPLHGRAFKFGFSWSFYD